METVTFGVAAVEDLGRNKAKIDEPIIVQAGINFYALEKWTIEHLDNQEEKCKGEAFEKIMLPAIQERFSYILAEQYKDNNLDGWTVSVRTSYGQLAQKCSSPEETMGWIEKEINATFEGQVPPFCFPDEYIGPDLIFMLHNQDFTLYVAVISQAKYRKDLNQTDALRTITPELLYCENRGLEKQAMSRFLTEDLVERWMKLKPKLLQDSVDKSCIRFMVQYPAPMKITATPGLIADDQVTINDTTRNKRKRCFLPTIGQQNASMLFGSASKKILECLKEI